MDLLFRGYPNFCFLPKELRLSAKKQPNFAQNWHFWSIWAKYWQHWDISSHSRPQNDANNVFRWFFGFFVHIGPGLAGSFGALLVGWLVVLARGLYLARHVFTLCNHYLFLKFFCSDLGSLGSWLERT